MLRIHYLSHQGNANSGFGAPGFRDRFQTELDNTGWPQLTRNIAVINGRIDGALDYSSCETAIESHTILTIGKHIPWLPASTGIVKFMPTSGTGFCEIFDGKYLLKHSYYKIKTTDLSLANLDTAPGGLYYTQKIIKMEGAGSSAVGLGLYSYTWFPVTIPTHSFIPTVSSLALTNGLTRDLKENLSTRNLVTSGETPFQTYYAPNNNEDHVSLTACSAEWIKQEIGGNYQPPFIGEYKIQGQAQICNTPETYTIPNLPTGTTLTWSIIPTSGVASLSTSGNTATLTKTGTGGVQLSATVNSACGNINLPIYDVYAGLPPSPGSTSRSLNPMCPGQIKVVSLLPRAGIDSYLWYTNDSGINVSGNGLSGSVEATAPGTYQLKIRAINSCGYTESTYFVSVRNYGDSRCSGIMYRYSVYPNPAGNEVTVAYVKNEKEQETQKFKKEFSMRLYNDKGKEVMFEKNNSEENSFSLNTSKLPEGTYYLNITDYEETIKKQIIIKH